MTRTQSKWAALVGCLAVGFAGCSPGSLGWLLRDTKTPPEFPLPVKEGKKEVTVLVVTDQPQWLSADPNLATAARDLAAGIGAELASETKGTKHPITVIDAGRLEQHKKTLPDWRTVSPAALGKQLGADYVVNADIGRISMFQPENAGEVYSGQAEVVVKVYDTARPDAVLQDYTHTSKQPERPTVALSPAAYKTQFLKRLGGEIAWKHVAHDTTAERIAR